MGSIKNTVQYCCVSRSNRILYAYGHGDHETDTLASLCLEKAPPFHRWYLETIGKRTFCFLTEEDGHVYFLIANEIVTGLEILHFLERFGDEFKKAAAGRKGSRGIFSTPNALEDRLVPAIRQLIGSLEKVHREAISPPPIDGSNGVGEISSSTKAPLLGKSHKQEAKVKKKKKKDHVITVRDSGAEVEEEHRKSTDSGSGSADLDSFSSGQSGASSLNSSQKEVGPARVRQSSQSLRKKWWRQVRIVLAIDVVICLVLLGVWLGVCRGISCVR